MYEKSYPAVRFVVRFGWPLSILAGLVPLAGAVAAFLMGQSLVLVVLLAVAMPAAFLLVKTMTELVDIICDMLLPK